MGNPFEDESTDLLRLHNKDVMDSASIQCLTTIQAQGKDQYDTFIQERLKSQTKTISDVIKSNKVILFKELPQRKQSKTDQKVILLKNELSYFARLYVACQTRSGNLSEFFKHGNQPFPPSLSSYGTLRQGKKADLMECLN